MSRIINFLIILCLLLSLTGTLAEAQTENQQIIDQVKSQLDVMCGENGSLRTFCAENNISGKFVFDLTIEGKGNVLTVFLVSSDCPEIASKNLLKDKLYTLRFENVKIPKKQRIKFRHTLNF